MTRNRIATAIALFLIMSMVATLVALPASGRVPPISIPTYAYISVTPDPVGVGQTAFVNFWLDKVPPTAYQEFGDRWQNFTVKARSPMEPPKLWGRSNLTTQKEHLSPMPHRKLATIPSFSVSQDKL
jgi:hypothetical protein